MTQQVVGTDKTLLRCIQDGDLPRPDLMRWNAWQRWRREIGRRPTQSRDGYTTSAAEESALWKAVMLELYGSEWALELAAAEDAPAPEERDGQPGEPRLSPAAGAVPDEGAAPAPVTPRRSRGVEVSLAAETRPEQQNQDQGREHPHHGPAKTPVRQNA